MSDDDADDERPRSGDTDDPFEDMERDVSPHDGDPFSELSESYDNEGGETRSDAEFSLGDPFIKSSPPAEPSEESLWAESGAPDNEAEGLDGTDTAPTTEPVSQPTQPSPSADTDLFTDSLSRSGDPFEPGEGLFESVDIETVDPDSIWQELAGAESDGATRERVRTYADVSKHAFCEQCEHFSEPPAVACAHEGTEIVEFRDMETVRLIDCPVVAERKALESETSSTPYKQR